MSGEREERPSIWGVQRRRADDHGEEAGEAGGIKGVGTEAGGVGVKGYEGGGYDEGAKGYGRYEEGGAKGGASPEEEAFKDSLDGPMLN